MRLRISSVLIGIFFAISLSAQIQGAEFVRSNGKPSWTPKKDSVHYQQSFDTANILKWYWMDALQDWVTPDAGSGLNDEFLSLIDFTSANCDYTDGQIVHINDTGAKYFISTDTVRGYPTDGIGVIELCNGLFARLEGEITPYQFGAIGDGTFDDAPALNRMMLYMAVKEIDNDVSGQFYTGSKVSIDGKAQSWLPASNRSTATKTIDGELRIKALNQIDTMLEILNFSHCTWREKVQVIGRGSVPFSQRTCEIGVYISSASRASFGGFHARAFKLFGVRMNSTVANNGAINIREVTVERIGSGTFNNPPNSEFSDFVKTSDTGSENNSNQRSVLTVTTPPDMALSGIDRPNYGIAIINDEPYHITSLTGNTIEVYPWVPVTTGDIIYVYGAGLSIRGADGGITGIDIINANNCGVAMDISPIYGIDVGRLVSQFNGISIVYGLLPTSANISSDIDMAYFEADAIEYYQVTRALTPAGAYSISTLYAHDFDRWFVPYNRNNAFDKNWLGDFEVTTSIGKDFISVDSLKQ